MRSLGESPINGSRASDGAAPPASQTPRMTFTGPVNESAIDDALLQPLQSIVLGSRDHRKRRAPLPDAKPADESAPHSPSKHDAAQHCDPSLSTRYLGHSSDDDFDNISLSSGGSKQLHTSCSPLLTPSVRSVSRPASAISEVSSPRISVGTSLLGDTDSQAHSEDEEMEPETPSLIGDNNSTVQLVMPSIKMPSRRPFTDQGRRIGRLKVLLAGDSGVGKTDLIQAIVQTAPAVVHVDPIPPPPPVRGRRSSNRASAQSATSRRSTNHITEILASTKPKPDWWSEVKDSQVSGSRRSSVGGEILDRNICFIDTPGYSDGASSMETIIPTVRYVESFFDKVSANGTTDPDMVNMLGGDGGNQVDAVLYLIKTALKPADLKYLQLLASLTNVIPVIAQADTMTVESVVQCKARIRSELTQAGIRVFSFTDGPDWPYAVSSLPGLDHDIMDASFLMSSDYQRPLVASELIALTEQLFCERGASWLRHAAAQKYLKWKESGLSCMPSELPRQLCVSSGPQILSNALGLCAYSQTAHLDMELREERLERMRLSSWASRLQTSLTRERAQLDATARAERASWLLERLSEDVRDGRIVAVKDGFKDIEHSAPDLSEKGQNLPPRTRRITSTELHQDPLGLVETAAAMKARSWHAVQVLSGVGLLGGVTFWAVKQGWCTQAIGFVASTWTSFWYDEN